MEPEDSTSIVGRWVRYKPYWFKEQYYYRWDRRNFVTFALQGDNGEWVYWHNRNREKKPMPEGINTLDERMAVALMLAKMEA